jgi:hypothetical protein
MAGAICQNRTLGLEAVDETKSINLHITNIEKELHKTKEYLLLPRTGLEAKLGEVENTQNQKLAAFQTEMLTK